MSASLLYDTIQCINVHLWNQKLKKMKKTKNINQYR